jgi:hypothetical protein
MAPVHLKMGDVGLLIFVLFLGQDHLPAVGERDGNQLSVAGDFPSFVLQLLG